MPVKTGADSFDEGKIYPGHLVQFVRRDGKLFTFRRVKCRRLMLRGKKALHLRHTKIWRRAHKKEAVLKSQKRTIKEKTIKFSDFASERGVVGMSIQDLMRKKEATEEQREKMRSAAEKRKGLTGNHKKKRKEDLNKRLKEMRKKKEEAKKGKKKDDGQKGGDKGKKGKKGKGGDKKKKRGKK